jgi:hypothetical protein
MLHYIAMGERLGDEEGRTTWKEKSAKCVGVGCHLSPHYHNSPYMRFEGIWGAPPLKRMAVHMGMRHLSRGAHLLFGTCSNQE